MSTTQAQERALHSLAEHLRTGDWDFASQQDMADCIADKIDALLATPPSAAPAENEDAALLDWLDKSGATVEILPGGSSAAWQFRVGGLHSAVSNSLRDAIRAARKDGK